MRIAPVDPALRVVLDQDRVGFADEGPVRGANVEAVDARHVDREAFDELDGWTVRRKFAEELPVEGDTPRGNRPGGAVVVAILGADGYVELLAGPNHGRREPADAVDLGAGHHDGLDG